MTQTLSRNTGLLSCRRTPWMLVFVALLIGCAPKDIPAPIPLTRSTALSENDANLQLENAITVAEQVHSGQFLFDSVIALKDERQGFKQAFAFAHPDALRAEFFLPGLNQTNLLVVVRDGTIEALNVPDRVIYRGESNLKNIQRLLSIPAEADDLMRWISGRLPFTSDQIRRVTLSRTGNRSVGGGRLENVAEPNGVRGELQLNDGRVAEVIIDSRGLLLALDIRARSRGTRLFVSRLEYASAEDAQGSEVDQTLPSRIKFWIPGRSLTGDLMAVSQKLNPELTSESRLFQIIAPKSFREEPLD